MMGALLLRLATNSYTVILFLVACFLVSLMKALPLSFMTKVDVQG